MPARVYTPTPRNLRLLAATLKRGELVAIPTETVYGLAADALSTAAMLLSPAQLAQLTREQPGIASLVVDAIGQRHHHGSPFA